MGEGPSWYPLTIATPMSATSLGDSPKVSQNRGQRASRATSSTGEKFQGMPEAKTSWAAFSANFRTSAVSQVAASPNCCGPSTPPVV